MPMIEPEFSGEDKQAFPSPVHRDAGVCLGARHRLTRSCGGKSRPFQKENVMRGRVMMVLASAVLAGSLLATDAQARGGGGGGGGHGGGGGRIGGFGGGHMAGMRGEHFGGRRHFAHGGLYDYGLGCPYYQTYTWPYSCDY